LQIQKHLSQQNKSIPLFHPMQLLDFAMRGIKVM
jgi:glycolate oxidase iron-sulfur subunit